MALNVQKRNKVIGILILVVLAGFLVLPVKSVAPDFFNRGKQDTRILFVGDIMLSRAIGKIMERNEDWHFPFRLIEERVKNADIAFANLENPVSLRGENQGSIYSFRADPRAIAGLSMAGFDIVSIANNHMYDWGSDAFLDTMKYLGESGIKYVGGGETLDTARTPVIIESGGTKFAFLAYSQFVSLRAHPLLPTVAPMDMAVMLEDIEQAKKISQVVIVSLHWGDEYETNASQEQKDIAHALIDAGATLVVGHHPHVIQEIESYKNGLIAYSLGNFVFDQNFSEDTRRGLMLEVVFRDNRFYDYMTTAVNFNDAYQPFIP